MTAREIALQAKRQRYLDQRRNRRSENAQAEREIASLDTTSDPEPGAFYGLTPPEPAPTHEPTHA